MGNPGASAGQGGGFLWYDTTFSARYMDNNTVVERTGAKPGPGWTHLAANFDRNGNLELFVDGVSQGTTGGMTSTTFDREFTVVGGALPAQGTNFNLMGPCALHAALLTNAQIETSVRTKYVQILTTTMGAYDMREIILNAATFWELVGTSTYNATALPDAIPPLYQPVQTGGGITTCPSFIALDLSGNGRHLGFSQPPVGNHPFFK